MKKVFAEKAWLGPGRFARRVLVEFDRHVRSVRELTPHESPPPDTETVQWLTPGLVNAHCHLEYTWLEDAGLPRGPIPFGEWMRAIMARRPTSQEDSDRRADAMRLGAERLLHGGCTAVVDSSTDGASAKIFGELRLPHILFYEVLGLSQQRAEPIWNGALDFLRRSDNSGDPHGMLLGAGLNPHAPYSVGEWLREQLKSPDGAQWPQAWHLAETPDEEQLFQHGEGSIAEVLRSFGMPLPSGQFASSFDVLRSQQQLERCGLVFHGNELSTDDLAFFAAPRGIVHCPGTHRWFVRKPLPLRSWLNAGVNVCLGTDSLASAETLSMLDVVRMTLEDDADLTADDVLTMACANPWRLGMLHRAHAGALPGEISAGAPADLVGLAIAGDDRGDADGDAWRAALVASGSHAAAVWISGERRA